MVEFLNSEQFRKQIFDYSKGEPWNFQGDTPIILNLSATWCGPCRMFAPVLEQVSDEYEGKLKVYKVDTDVSPEIPALFGTKGVPATLFISKNDDPALVMGAVPLDSMKEAIKDQFGL